MLPVKMYKLFHEGLFESISAVIFQKVVNLCILVPLTKVELLNFDKVHTYAKGIRVS